MAEIIKLRKDPENRLALGGNEKSLDFRGL
jgi:hypothetical protein